MKELYTLIHILRMKPVVFTMGVHEQISPKYLERRKQISISFNSMKEECKNSVNFIQEMGLTLAHIGEQFRMLSGAFNPYYKDYIRGLRQEYNRYHACLNSPQWR